jgi:hypothetical protein
MTTVNNAPTPVLESIAVAINTDEDCAAIKSRFGIETRTHRKGADSSSGMESHHILQDKAMTGNISKYSGHAVLLNGKSGGTHDVVNASQIARNCPPGSGGGAGPTTFGALQQAARDDLVKGFKQEGKTDEEAKKLADCLVAEAVAATQDNRAKKKKPYLTQNSPVSPVQGCLASGTLVWLDAFERIPIETLRVGTMIAARSAECRVVRTDQCWARVVSIAIDGEVVRLAPYHRVRLPTGRSIRVDALRTGHTLCTVNGPAHVTRVESADRAERVFNFGLGHADACRVGRCGLWVEITDQGPPMRSPQRIVSPLAREDWTCPT